MGDPFSIATGVAGLVSLGITVCDGLHTYFSAIRNRKDDLAIVTQNVALFKFHIFAVQSGASKLGHRHSPAIDGLQLSLINCEMQLKCLETLLNEMLQTEEPSLTKEIWRKQKLMARYPFDCKKLVQLEEYLSRANTTLSSFIQALNLDINIRMSDELEAFRTSLEALDINTQTTLRTITTRLDVIGPKVEPSTFQLLPSRIEEVTASSSNSIVLHQTAVGAANMKTCVPRNGRSSQDRNDAHSTPRYLQNAELEHRLYHLADSVIKELRAIYRSEKAWPFDVDQNGNNVAHICLSAFLYGFKFKNALESSGIMIDAICKILSYLGDIDQWVECDDCTCYVAAQLLLKADCKVTVSQGWAEILADCSLKARKLFFQHLKDRRQRLRNIALSILPEKILHQYGVATSSLPDKTATLLWKELQQAQDQQDHQVWLPNSLDPCNNLCVMPESFFDFPHHPQVIELARNYGFAPRDENGVQTLLSGRLSTPQPFTGTFIILLPAFRSSSHCILHLESIRTARFKDIATSHMQQHIPVQYSMSVLIRHVYPTFGTYLARNVTASSCIDLLKISECSSEYLYMAKCAIHILTMMSLEVRHLPICLTEKYDDLKDSMANEDWKEILDEDRELIDQLEALDEEFGDVFDHQSVSIAEFLSGYWLTRMEEVLRELSKPLSDDDRYNLLEAGIVLEEDSANDSECHVECTG
ncbi:pyruvate decarboxylase [Fusarium mexicanum]|uniref:Pyruvate decarboxylase n=1 Tax=Fusarium mexicanum TaxID=751941 RepID=A0A8H5I510_9HYPO|nr:pyruvate decarboxylase [Fusarium mexicanum]